jgi:hypothetical protein
MTISRKFTIIFAVVTIGGLAGLLGWGEMLTPASQPRSTTKLVTQPPASVTDTYHAQAAAFASVERTPEQKVVDQMIDRYRMTLTGGTLADICAQAGVVKAAYLQAGDQQGYSNWTKQEFKSCHQIANMADTVDSAVREMADSYADGDGVWHRRKDPRAEEAKWTKIYMDELTQYLPKQ